MITKISATGQNTVDLLISENGPKYCPREFSCEYCQFSRKFKGNTL